MSTQFAELESELDRESWGWLSDTHPTLADALEVAVKRGASPDDIRRMVLTHCGGHRSELATRMKLAARHLGAVK